MTKSHRRLQTQTERSILTIKDQYTNNLAQILSNKLSFNDNHKATVVSGIMNKILVNQDSRDSVTRNEQKSEALKNQNLATRFNTQIELDKFYEEMQENELLVTESQDDAYAPRQDIITKVVQEAKKNDRQTIQPVYMNTNECGSVGTPPRVESRLSNN